MRLLATLTLSVICFTAIAQDRFIDTELKYTDSAGKDVIIQNSLPKGGGYLDSVKKIGYTDPAGKNFSYVVFWTHVINERATPLELTLNFPVDSLAIFPSPESYLKLLLPAEPMTADKEPLGDYGIKGLKYFLDTAYNKPASLQMIISPKDDAFFYVAALFHNARGSARAALSIKGQRLFYRISVGQSSVSVPCGRIVYKDQE